MNRTFCFTALLAWLVVGLTGSTPSFAQDSPTRPLADSADLLDRYPAGKTWRSMSIMRVDGMAENEDWGFRGTRQFVATNRYETQVSVLGHDQIGTTHKIRLRIDVIDAGTMKIVSDRRVSLVGLDASDPLFDLAIDMAVESVMKGHPAGVVASKLLEKWEQIDPNYQKTLTRIANGINLPLEKFARDPNVLFLEQARKYAGCSFEAIWMNGYGIVEAKQIDNGLSGRIRLDPDELNRWAAGSDPLASLYVYPSLAKRVGDRWTLDASHATAVFAGYGDAKCRGELDLRYRSDESYAAEPVRDLGIEAGQLDIIVQENGDEVRYEIGSMDGTMKIAQRDAMLMMGNGSGDIKYSRLSKDHFLFRAKIRRDVNVQWRYEMSRIEQPDQ